MEDREFINTFLRISLHRICDLYLGKLKVAFRPLTKEQFWKTTHNDSNSIGGIIFHICEHIRISELSLKREDAKFREDFVIYFPEESADPAEVIGKLEEQINSWKEIMAEYIEENFNLAIEDVHDLYNLVEHISYHLGQVIDKIQELTGLKFKFYDNGLNESFLRAKIEG